MRCLLVSDLHYTLKQFDWVNLAADHFDLVVIAGDMLDIVSVADTDAQIIVILKYLKRLQSKTRLVVSSGNHDLNGRNAADEKVCRWLAKARQMGASTDGDYLEVDGTSFTICPWWDGPVSRDEVGRQLARDAERRKDRWVWIYHAPPDESPVSWVGTKHFGDKDLVRWIHQYGPSAVLTGHIHQAPFRAGGSWVDQIASTWVFNAGRQIGPCPTHVIIDLSEQRAAWFSLAGNEIVELGEPLTRPVPELREPFGPVLGSQ
jgi:Icc-related predicted phosphoesterase